MAKGDKVEVVLGLPSGVERVHFQAEQAGEAIEVNRNANRVEIVVNDRNGNPKRTAVFAASAVLGTIEHPAGGRKR